MDISTYDTIGKRTTYKQIFPASSREPHKDDMQQALGSCPCGLNTPAGNLPAVEACKGSNSILVLAALNLLITTSKVNLDVAGVALVRVNTTVRTVSATACFLA
jgi:hypothetical protein